MLGVLECRMVGFGTGAGNWTRSWCSDGPLPRRSSTCGGEVRTVLLLTVTGASRSMSSSRDMSVERER